MNRIRLLALLGVVCLAASAMAEPVALNPRHPERYTVQPGDTLWDIAGRFLRDPWLWPEVWHVNPQIDNPHLIYPGDTVSLVYEDGRPLLTVRRGHPTVKLSPEVREERLERAIPTIPIDAIQQFLNRPLVVEAGEMEALPYVVASADEHIVVGAGDRVYVRGIDTEQHTRYHVFRADETYVDPDTEEVLGHEALYLGEGVIQAFGDPATLKLTRTNREVSIGDRVRPVLREDYQVNFLPHPPEQDVEGRIISVVDGVSQIGQYQVVVLNRGAADDIEVGHVLAIYRAGETIRDLVSEDAGDTVQLPDERAGVLMVFRVFDRVSYALVMRASRAIHVLDMVRNP